MREIQHELEDVTHRLAACVMRTTELILRIHARVQQCHRHHILFLCQPFDPQQPPVRSRRPGWKVLVQRPELQQWRRHRIVPNERRLGTLDELLDWHPFRPPLLLRNQVHLGPVHDYLRRPSMQSQHLLDAPDIQDDEEWWLAFQRRERHALLRDGRMKHLEVHRTLVPLRHPLHPIGIRMRVPLRIHDDCTLSLSQRALERHLDQQDSFPRFWRSHDGKASTPWNPVHQSVQLRQVLHLDILRPIILPRHLLPFHMFRHRLHPTLLLRLIGNSHQCRNNMPAWSRCIRPTSALEPSPTQHAGGHLLAPWSRDHRFHSTRPDPQSMHVPDVCRRQLYLLPARYPFEHDLSPSNKSA